MKNKNGQSVQKVLESSLLRSLKMLCPNLFPVSVHAFAPAKQKGKKQGPNVK